MNYFLNSFIVLIGIAGFFLASHIHKKKRHRATLVCPIGSNCEAVVHSEHSMFFGVPLEIAGMLYYAFIVCSYVWFLFLPQFVNNLFAFIVLVATVGALIFSLYLSSVQILALREKCTWCFISAFLSVLIFVAALLGLEAHVGEVMRAYISILAFFRLFSSALGFGGMCVFLLLLIRYSRDLRIVKEEAQALLVLSQVIWTSLFLMLITSIGKLESGMHVMQTLTMQNIYVEAVLLVTMLMSTVYFVPRIARMGDLHHAKKIRAGTFIMSIMACVSWGIVFAGEHTMTSDYFLYIIFIILLAIAVPAGWLLASWRT